MHKNKIIVTLGILIALLPVLGFPHSWESFFQILAGLSIAIFSVWTTIDKKLTLKAKAYKRQAQKRRTAELGAQKEVVPEVPVEYAESDSNTSA